MKCSRKGCCSGRHPSNRKRQHYVLRPALLVSAVMLFGAGYASKKMPTWAECEAGILATGMALCPIRSCGKKMLLRLPRRSNRGRGDVAALEGRVVRVYLHGVQRPGKVSPERRIDSRGFLRPRSGVPDAPRSSPVATTTPARGHHTKSLCIPCFQEYRNAQAIVGLRKRIVDVF